jgi:uncharacterized membrane protein
MDPSYANHPWWGFIGWVVPMLLIVGLVAVAVWMVARTTRERPQAAVALPAAPPAPPPAGDAAMEHARRRYAQGEIGREEYLQIANDLGGGQTGEEADRA